MTSSEFIIWLKGFTEGVHEYNITPKQWDLLKEKLTKVNDSALASVAEPYWTYTNSTDKTLLND